MASKTTNRFSPEVRTLADHSSRWATVTSIAAKIGCTAQTLHQWVGRAERDSGRKPGLITDMAAKLKTLERENRELRQAKFFR
jgi:transposase